MKRIDKIFAELAYKEQDSLFLITLYKEIGDD